MINVNRTILKLEVLFTAMTHADLWLMSKELHETLIELDLHRNDVIANTYSFGQNVDEVKALNEQIYFLKQNIKIVETALLCHESKIFEKSVRLGNEIGMLCYN